MSRTTVADSFSLNRALDDAGTALRIAPLPLWLGGFLLTVSDGCGSSLSKPSWPDAGSGGDPIARVRDFVSHNFAAYADHSRAFWLAKALSVAMGAIAGVLLMLALNAFLQTGFLRMHESLLVQGRGELAPLWSGGDRFLAMLGWKLLSGVLSLLAVGAAAVPGGVLIAYGLIRGERALSELGLATLAVFVAGAGVYVGVGVYLGELAVAFERASPLTALRRSFALARGNRLRLLGFALGCGLIQLLSVFFGVLLCCVGLIATVPLARAWTGFAKTESFLLLTRGVEESERWSLWRNKAHAIGHTSGPVQGWGEPPP